ncbi:TPA: hypothetical protein DEP96_02320 [Candidatus Uhrbacteria bacterium]|nr:hypothetical protein [Candidatus Uhrbacteria bacterium]
MVKTRVVILAAGKGKRMASELPKPLVAISGRPMIAHLISSVVSSEVDLRPIVVVAPDSLELFKTTLGDVCDYAVQSEQLGTGHAVLQAKEALEGADSVVVLYGDHPFIPASTLVELVKLHDEQPDSVAMLTSTVPNYEAPYDAFVSWGRILRGSKGEVEDIREVKDCTETEKQIREVNPALYAFPCAWLWQQLPKLDTENASQEFYLTDVIPLAVSEGRPIVTASADPLDVMGVNTLDELSRAEEVFNKKEHKM